MGARDTESNQPAAPSDESNGEAEILTDGGAVTPTIEIIKDAVEQIETRQERNTATLDSIAEALEAMTDGAELADEFEIGRGAVLYNDRDDSTGRDLHHVTGRLYDVDSGRCYYRVWDGTHTDYRFYFAEDLLVDFTPAGWQFPVHLKPTYHLTRECGVDDSADLMTDGGQPEAGYIHGAQCPACGYDYAETVEARIKGRGAAETMAVRECGDCGTLWGEKREFFGVLRE